MQSIAKQTCELVCNEPWWLLLMLLPLPAVTVVWWWWCEDVVWWWAPEVSAISCGNELAVESLAIVSPLPPPLCEECGWCWYTWGIGPGNRLVRTQYLATEEANATAVPTRRSADVCGLLPTWPTLDELAKLPGYEGRQLWPEFTSYQYTFRHGSFCFNFFPFFFSMQHQFWHALVKTCSTRLSSNRQMRRFLFSSLYGNKFHQTQTFVHLVT